MCLVWCEQIIDKEVFFDREVLKEHVEEVYIDKYVERVVEILREVPVDKIVERRVEVIKEIPVIRYVTWNSLTSSTS